MFQATYLFRTQENPGQYRIEAHLILLNNIVILGDKTIHYIIYKITNTINNKIYIGKHQTKDINDGYMGSGKYLNNAKAKYGIENFKKEILFIFETEVEMNNKEKELVTEEFCLREDTYNICIGGQGGFGYINSHEHKNMWARKGYDSLLKKYGPEYMLEFQTKSLKIKKKMNPKSLENFRENFKNSNSEEANQKRKETFKNKKVQQGKNNSNYGKCWVYHPDTKECLMIYKNLLEEYQNNGFLKGNLHAKRKVKDANEE